MFIIRETLRLKHVKATFGAIQLFTAILGRLRTSFSIDMNMSSKLQETESCNHGFSRYGVGIERGSLKTT